MDKMLKTLLESQRLGNVQGITLSKDLHCAKTKVNGVEVNLGLFKYREEAAREIEETNQQFSIYN